VRHRQAIGWRRSSSQRPGRRPAARRQCVSVARFLFLVRPPRRVGPRHSWAWP